MNRRRVILVLSVITVEILLGSNPGFAQEPLIVDAPTVDRGPKHVLLHGTVAFEGIAGEPEPQRGAIFTTAPSMSIPLDRRGWFHRGRFVVSVPAGETVHLYGYQSGLWFADPETIEVSEDPDDISLTLRKASPSELVAINKKSKLRMEADQDSLAEADPDELETGSLTMHGTFRLPEVWRSGEPSITFRQTSADGLKRTRVVPHHLLEIEETKDPEVSRWTATGFAPGLFDVGLTGVTQPLTVPLDADHSPVIELQAPALYDVVLHVDNRLDSKVEELEWELGEYEDFAPLPPRVAPWIKTVMRGSVEINPDGAFRFRAPAGEVRVHRPEEGPVIGGIAALTIRPTQNELRVKYPFSVPTAAVVWSGDQSNARGTWGASLWPLSCRGRVAGGTGSYYVYTDPGPYAVFYDGGDEYLPVEPFVTVLERGEFNEVWIEIERRDGKPADLKRQ